MASFPKVQVGQTTHPYFIIPGMLAHSQWNGSVYSWSWEGWGEEKVHPVA